MMRFKSLLRNAVAILPAVFGSAASAATVTTLAAFPQSDPSLKPVTGVTVIGGILYGTTSTDNSGAAAGTVFQINLATLAESTIYTFRGNSGAFGSTTDGSVPSQLLAVGKQLYGTTFRGGVNYHGTIFRISPKGTSDVVVHQFTGADGANPGALEFQDSLFNYQGVLYGTTSAGGTNNEGTVFAISKSGTFTNVYNFASDANGCDPVAGVIIHAGVLYGTTQGCGTSGYGTVYSIDLSAGKYSVLYTFPTQANALKLLFQKDVLFGTTNAGGSDGVGSVYTIDLVSGAYALLHSFSKSEVYNPAGGLTALNGELYGVATHSSPQTSGGIFSIDPQTGVEAVATYFSGQNVQPYGALFSYSGSLYGTTSNLQPLGVADAGTVYKFSP